MVQVFLSEQTGPVAKWKFQLYSGFELRCLDTITRHARPPCYHAEASLRHRHLGVSWAAACPAGCAHVKKPFGTVPLHASWPAVVTHRSASAPVSEPLMQRVFSKGMQSGLPGF